MSDISNQLIKNSYDYVLQSDLVTGVVYRIGGTVPVNPIFLSGLTINSGFTYSNGTEQNGYVLTCDASGNANWGPAGGTTGVYLPLSGGTVTGGTTFQSGLTANTISATTYYNLPVSAVTNGTGISASTSNGTVTITNTAPDQVVTISGGTGITTGGTYPNFTLVNSAPDQTVTITGGTNIQIAGTYPNFGVNYTGQTSFPYLPLSGGTVTGGTTFQSGLTANTISATTYQNLPSSFQSVRISGTTQFSANTGTFINFSGVNISITSASTNTLVFSGSPQFTVPGSNNQVLTSNGSGGAVAESLLIFDGASTSPTLEVNKVCFGRGNGNNSSNISIGEVAFSSVFTPVGGNNIAIGNSSLKSNTAGDVNIAIGVSSLNKNTGGSYNVAIGGSSLSCNTKGDGNTSIGFTSLSANTTGKFNVSLGYKSMSNSQSVCYGLNYNISIGYKNMYKACGDSNISMGKFSLYNVSQCMFGNIAIGDKSLGEGTCISRNIGIGDNSLKKLSTGNYNIGIGDCALYGYGCTISFSRNIALGAKSQKEKCLSLEWVT